jgi:hypothetical protein
MNFLNQETLADLTGYTRPGEIALCLDRQGVKYFVGKRGRVWTTREALNVALGLPIQPITQISRDLLDTNERITF